MGHYVLFHTRVNLMPFPRPDRPFAVYSLLHPVLYFEFAFRPRFYRFISTFFFHIPAVINARKQRSLEAPSAAPDQLDPSPLPPHPVIICLVFLFLSALPPPF